MPATEAISACVVRRVIAAPVSAVYRAWTDLEFLKQWNWGREYESVAVEQDCRVGGIWKQQIRDKKTGENWYFDGVFEAVTPGKKLVHTFHFRSDRGKDEGPSKVVIEFLDHDGSTEVVITHTQLAPDKKKGTEAGWVEVLECVERCVLA
ncbi:MAG: SRPBCC domain-containing protein [Planctomycetes bacterium]|nr:SRPBCC domain-containing protein [Planctomycetota bacterium]